MKSRILIPRTDYLVCILLLSSGLIFSDVKNANAVEVNVDLVSGTEYTNNVSLRSTDTNEDVMQSLALNVRALEERRRFNADINFSLEQRYYFNDSFEDETTLSTGLGILNFDIIEDFLDWRSSFSRSQVINNPLESDTPDNRYYRDIIRTGPNIFYRINSISSLTFNSNYVFVELEDPTVVDSERIDSRASYQWSMNSLTTFSADIAHNKVIDAEWEPRNSTIRYSLGLARQMARGNVALNGGYSQSRPDSEEKTGSIFYQLSGIYEGPDNHLLNFSARREVSDSLIGFESSQFESGLVNGDGSEESNSSGSTDIVNGNAGGSPVVNAQLDATSEMDVIERTNITAGLSRSIANYQYSFSCYWGAQDYSRQLLDSRTKGCNTNLSSEIRSGIVVGLHLASSKSNFISLPQQGKDKTDIYRVFAEYSATQDLSISGNVQYQRRGNEVDYAREFEEFSMGVDLTWHIR